MTNYMSERPQGGWVDTDTGLPFWPALALASLVAFGIIAASVLVFGDIAHLIHPSCASVLECIRL